MVRWEGDHAIVEDDAALWKDPFEHRRPGVHDQAQEAGRRCGKLARADQGASEQASRRAPLGKTNGYC